MLPNPQNRSLMNLVVDLQNVLFIQVFLIPPTPLYLQKNSKSLIGWKLLLHYKNHLKLAIVLQQSQGDWRTHRQMHISVYAIPTSSFPPFLPPSHNAITETWFSLRKQKKKISLSCTSESVLTFGNHSWFLSVWELIKLWGLMRLFRNRSAKTYHVALCRWIGPVNGLWLFTLVSFCRIRFLLIISNFSLSFKLWRESEILKCV